MISVKISVAKGMIYGIIMFGLSGGLLTAYYLLQMTIPFPIPPNIAYYLDAFLISLLVLAFFVTARGFLQEYKLVKMIIGFAEVSVFIVLFTIFHWGIYIFTFPITPHSTITLELVMIAFFLILLSVQVFLALSFVFEWLHDKYYVSRELDKTERETWLKAESDLEKIILLQETGTKKRKLRKLKKKYGFEP